MPHFISLENLKQLPVIDPKNPPKGEENDPGGYLSFHPLAGERGTYYPLFRVYKDHLYQGKPWKKTEKSPVFGALNFDPNASHGLDSFGTRAGYYGDVVFVLDKNKFKDHILYTAYAKGRAFSNPKNLLYDLILQQNSTDIYRQASNPSSLLDAVLQAIEIDIPHVNSSMKDFEVQIFQDIPFTNEYIKEIIFASSVSSEKREEIKASISEKAKNSHAQQPNYKEYTYPEIETLLPYFEESNKEKLLLLVEALYRCHNEATIMKGRIKKGKFEEFESQYNQIKGKLSFKLQEILPSVHCKLLTENSSHFLQALKKAKGSLDTENIPLPSSPEIEESLKAVQAEIDKILNDYFFNIGDIQNIRKILPQYRKNIYNYIQTLENFKEPALAALLAHLKDSLQMKFSSTSSSTSVAKPENASEQSLSGVGSLHLNSTLGGGNCFYHAVYEALHNQKSTVETQRTIREHIVESLRSNQQLALSHFGTRGALDEFIELISRDNEWVPDFGPSIVADALEITIVIHRTDNSIYYEATPDAGLGRNSQNTIHLQYTGAHYNSFTDTALE